MKVFNRPILSIALIVGGIICIFLSINRPVSVIIDGMPESVHSNSLSVKGILQDAGIYVEPGDRVQPSPETWLFMGQAIFLHRAETIQILIDGKQKTYYSTERLPANLIGLAGAKLFPGDRILVDGLNSEPNQPLEAAPMHTLSLLRAQPILIKESTGASQMFYSSAATLGQALWEHGIRLQPTDRVDLELTTVLNHPLEVMIFRSREITVQVDGKEVLIHSSASRVDEALAEAGLSLQGMDYSIPDGSAAIPATGVVRLVRVREEVVLTQTLTPFKTDYQPDPETELDQRSVITPGVNGLKVSRTRIRYEDGKEVSRQDEGEWVVNEPQDQVTGYGTKVVIHTLDTENGQLKYWRKIQVYATSYSPCNSGTSKCYTGTSLGLPVQKGVVAVSRNWYRDMAGQSIYVPGYGKAVVADTGGGIPGEYWIDLGFSDSNYQPWHQWTTIYFLIPVPPNIPYILYP